MRALVLGAAWAPGADGFYAGLARDSDFVIAADAAAERLLAAGVEPDLAVGDFDSSRVGALERLAGAGIETLVFPAVKDVTDLEIAARAAREAGATSVVVSGAFRDRRYHTLAALGVLARLADLVGTGVEPDMTLHALDAAARPTLFLALAPGTLVSLIAPLGVASGVTLRGFAYPLEDARLEPLAGLGVSNVTAGARQSVAVGGGGVLVIVDGGKADDADQA